MRTRALLATLVACAAGCADGEQAIPVDALFSDPVVSYDPDEAIAYEDRGDGASYGLPRDGMQSIADLIALFPDEGVGSREPNVFASPDTVFTTDQCRGGEPSVVDDLPITVEAVVTLHPRQYMKVEICGQDERHYGVYTIEDDTGGIVVLRDSRVAPFTFGDRVQVTAHALTLTFGRDVDTRAIMVADVEQIPESDPILYRQTDEPFGLDDIGETVEVRGFVQVEPTSLNFNSMVLASERFSQNAAPNASGDLLQCIRSCESDCLDGCPSAEACSSICPDLCVRNDAQLSDDDLPVCWFIGVDAELGRRGFQPEYGTELRIRGPVVNNFDVQMWVLSPGQVEEL